MKGGKRKAVSGKRNQLQFHSRACSGLPFLPVLTVDALRLSTPRCSNTTEKEQVGLLTASPSCPVLMVLRR
jgi:hypothetical protein